jgi:hypothetical protein
MAAITGLSLTTAASAANLFGLFSTGADAYSLGSFSSSDPSMVSFSAISGVSSGEQLLSLDYRPATGQLYAIGSLQNVYTISSSGIAVDIGGFDQAVPGTNFGFDFNPAFMGGEFARIISDTDDNRVISGMDGSYLAPTEKTDVFYDTGDVNEGANPNINHIAYTNSVAGATSTQQYGIDSDLNVLTTVANNAGTLATVGLLGIDAGAVGGFDIVGSTGESFFAFQDGENSSLYSINLSTGAATSLGIIPGSIVGLTAVPEPSAFPLIFGLLGLGVVLTSRRRALSK